MFLMNLVYFNLFILFPLSKKQKIRTKKAHYWLQTPIPLNIFRAKFSTYILHDIHDILFTTSVSRIEKFDSHNDISSEFNEIYEHFDRIAIVKKF